MTSNNYFSDRNVFQNGVNTLLKMVNHSCQKAQILHGLDHAILFKFHQPGPDTYQKIYGETSDCQCQHQQ